MLKYLSTLETIWPAAKIANDHGEWRTIMGRRSYCSKCSLNTTQESKKYIKYLIRKEERNMETARRIATIRQTDKSPMYEGKNPKFLEEPICMNCSKRPPKLLRCSRCQVAWYCSAACQKEHYREHHVDCRDIADKWKRVQREEQFLLVTRPYGGNVFQSAIGYFWDMKPTQDYMVATHELAETYYSAAYTSHAKEA